VLARHRAGSGRAGPLAIYICSAVTFWFTAIYIAYCSQHTHVFILLLLERIFWLLA